jgi:hypothetical protein
MKTGQTFGTPRETPETRQPWVAPKISVLSDDKVEVGKSGGVEAYHTIGSLTEGKS